MKFAKLHGLGNDFLVVDVSQEERYSSSLAALARRICHRHCGVGADGILYYQPTVADPDADVSALIFNADGSKAEMSGNGVRCLAALLYRSGRLPARAARIRTVSGVRVLTLQKEEGARYVFEASMGPPVTASEHIGVRLATDMDPILDYPIDVGSSVIRATITSMGNPHCSTFWARLEEAPVDALGPLLENHSLFPNRTNVEFIEVLEPHRIRVFFWERGAGRTKASGTGSCAAAVASMLRGLTQSPVTVETEMGSLLVRRGAGGEIMLTGQAEFICTGEYSTEEI